MQCKWISNSWIWQSEVNDKCSPPTVMKLKTKQDKKSAALKKQQTTGEDLSVLATPECRNVLICVFLLRLTWRNNKYGFFPFLHLWEIPDRELLLWCIIKRVLCTFDWTRSSTVQKWLYIFTIYCSNFSTNDVLYTVHVYIQVVILLQKCQWRHIAGERACFLATGSWPLSLSHSLFLHKYLFFMHSFLIST